MKIILFFIALLIFAPISKATIIGVGKQKAFTQIKQAIAAAQAGDTVLVESGLYKEGNIVINKKIFFLGNNLQAVAFPAMNTVTNLLFIFSESNNFIIFYHTMCSVLNVDAKKIVIQIVFAYGYKIAVVHFYTAGVV